MSYLAGYKTYIAAIGIALYGVSQYIGGDHAGAFKSFAEALGFVGVRSAIAGLAAS